LISVEVTIRKFGSKVHPPAEIALGMHSANFFFYSPPDGRQSLSVTSAEEALELEAERKPQDDIPEADDVLDEKQPNQSFNTGIA
jgi:hypothetical protein